MITRIAWTMIAVAVGLAPGASVAQADGNRPPNVPDLDQPADEAILTDTAPTLSWIDPGDPDGGPQAARNYQWFIHDVDTRQSVWSRDWHDPAGGPPSCRPVGGAPTSWTCNSVQVPAGLLRPGKNYSWSVEAGDGELGSGFARRRRFTIALDGGGGPFPEKEWPKASPESKGMDPRRLRSLPGIVAHAIVIRGGYEVHRQGDIDSPRQWASTARSFLATSWGMALTEGSVPGGMDALDQPVRELDTPTARKFGSAVKLKHLLSYTSCANPPGSRWSYSCGEHWSMQHLLFEELTGKHPADYVNAKLRPVLGGSWRADQVSDTTMRVFGSPAQLARWGYFWMRYASWNGQILVDPDFVQRSLEPMPYGSGVAAKGEDEGYQIHLNKTGRWRDCSTDSFAAMGAGGSIVFASPKMDLVVARKGPHLEPEALGEMMTPICRAVAGPATPEAIAQPGGR